MEVRKNYENVDNHQAIKEEQKDSKELNIKYPDTSNEKDKSLYSFN